jgi:hypothetical protein
MINIDKIISAAKTAEPIALSKRDYATDGYSAYAVYSIAKQTFAKLSLPFSLTSQQFYSYAKSGKINNVKSSTQRFTEDEVSNFIARMIASVAK